MWVFNKDFDKIDEDDINNLITNSVSEQQNLEYKEKPYGNSDDNKRELLRDISSFANAYGGYILIGIEEDGDGTPVNILGVEDAENEREKIMSSCLSNIEPRINGLDIRTVQIGGKDPILLIHIPSGIRAPHMVTFKGLNQFWRRHDKQKSPMSVDEIREIFSKTENLIENVDKFIKQRKKKILKSIGTELGYLIGAVPLTLKDEIINIKDERIRQIIKNPPNQRPNGYNMDFEINIFPEPSLHGLKIEYAGKKVELFLNGYFELLTEPEIYETNTQSGQYKHFYTLSIIEYAVSYFRVLRTLREYIGLNEPFIGFLSLLNIKGIGLFRDLRHHSFDNYFGPRPYPEEHLHIPPRQIVSLREKDETAKSFVDKIWNSFGYEEAPMFANVVFSPS